MAVPPPALRTGSMVYIKRLRISRLRIDVGKGKQLRAVGIELSLLKRKALNLRFARINFKKFSIVIF